MYVNIFIILLTSGEIKPSFQQTFFQLKNIIEQRI